MWFSHSVLAFFNSGTSHCLILDSFSASYSILVYKDTSWGLVQKVGISTKSEVVITYIIRQIVPLHEKRQYRMNFQIQGFCHIELWHFLSILFLKRSWSLLPTSWSSGIFRIDLQSGYHSEVSIRNLLRLFYILGYVFSELSMPSVQN